MSNIQESPGENQAKSVKCPCPICGLDEETANIVIKVAKCAKGIMFCYKLFKGATVLAATIAGSYTAIIGAIKLFQG